MAAWSRRWVPVIAYMAAIFALSSRSALPSAVAHVWDKLLHAGGYAPLAFLCVRALTATFSRPIDRRVVAIAWLITVAYGVSDEWHQSFVPNRMFDAGDLLADAVGAAIGIAACGLWLRAIGAAHLRRVAALRHRPGADDARYNRGRHGV